jgi:hypothetical protein
VHATGIVKETGKKFWSTKDAGQEPFKYQAGVGGVITGWDQVWGLSISRLSIPRSTSHLPCSQPSTSGSVLLVRMCLSPPTQDLKHLPRVVPFHTLLCTPVDSRAQRPSPSRESIHTHRAASGCSWERSAS